MCFSPVGRLRFEERSFSDNQLFLFSTSNPEELDIAKFSQRSFHLAPNEIHPVARSVGFLLHVLHSCCCEETLL